MADRVERQNDQMRTSELLADCADPELLFKLMVRPFTTVGVDTRYPFTLFEDELPSLIDPNTFSSFVRRVVVTPTIIDPSLAVPPKEYSKFNRKESSVFVGKLIEHRTWESSSKARKLDMFAANLVDSLRMITPKYISLPDSKILIQAIDQILINTKASLLS